MSDKFEKLKYLYSTLGYSERVDFVKFAQELEKKDSEGIKKESLVLETKAYSLGPVSVVNSSGRCALCGR